MDQDTTGLEFFAVIGFIVFVWGSAWTGFKLHETICRESLRKEILAGKRDANEEAELRMGDSLGAWLFGITALLIAIFIRYY